MHFRSASPSGIAILALAMARAISPNIHTGRAPAARPLCCALSCTNGLSGNSGKQLCIYTFSMRYPVFFKLHLLCTGLHAHAICMGDLRQTLCKVLHFPLIWRAYQKSVHPPRNGGVEI